MNVKKRTTPFKRVITIVLMFLLLVGCLPQTNGNSDAINTAAAQMFQTAMAGQTATPDYQATGQAFGNQPSDNQPASNPPTSTPAAFIPLGLDTSAHEGTDSCEDGENTTPLFFEKPTDVPWGTKEGASVAEIGLKPDKGFAGWDRFVAIAERILGTEMPYANSILTLYVTQYCGSLQAIKDWSITHATAMMNSSQDSAGNRPSLDEIPVVLLKRDGTIEWVHQVSNGPSLAEIQAHLEMRP